MVGSILSRRNEELIQGSFSDKCKKGWVGGYCDMVCRAPFRNKSLTLLVTGNDVIECGVSGWRGVKLTVTFNDFWDNLNDYCEPTTISDNIIADPLFFDPLSEDYHLQLGSPSIDSGTSVGAPANDKDGNARPFGGGFDMGAYEWPPFRINLPLILKE